MRRAEEPRSYNSDREYWDRVARTGERDQYRRSTENRGDREGPWGMRWDERDRDGAARDTGRSSSRRTTNNRGRGDTQWGPGSGQDGWRGGRAFGGLFGDQ